jgi:heme A synthase
MTTIFISVAVGALTFGLGILGMFLQKLLPENNMSSGSREMIGAVIGLVTLLLALVLGTLVGSAYGFFATQKSNVETLGARSIQRDMALIQYGPEAQPLRDGLKAALKRSYHTIWGGGDTDPKELEVETYTKGSNI